MKLWPKMATICGSDLQIATQIRFATHIQGPLKWAGTRFIEELNHPGSTLH